MELPALKDIGGDLNCHGNKQMNENSFPNLEQVGGNLVLSHSGFQKLPPKLKEVKGDAIIAKEDAPSLKKAIQNAIDQGIIHGELRLEE